MKYTHKLLNQYFKELVFKVKAVDASKIFEEHEEFIKAAKQLNSRILDLETSEEIFELMCSLTKEERRLLAFRASRVCWKRIARDLQRHRTTVSNRWQRAMGKICCSLNSSKL